MKPYRIFIVDDDPWYAATLEYHLSLNPDYLIHVFSNARECLNNLHLLPDLVTVDFSLPDMQGDQLYKSITAYNCTIAVVIISGQENIGIALELLKMGVTEYLMKDENTKDLLWNTVAKIRKTHQLQAEVLNLREQLSLKYDFTGSLIGQSEALKKIFTLMERAADTNINVSISGESGTGKELVAKAIHYNSTRKSKNFEAVNMAAIPENLAESELFGHEKGAFTGAVSRKIGKFEAANNGTIFLDEIAELNAGLQAKILRVLQERELVRVGGNDIVKLDIRVITATHKNLAAEVTAGNFREDLHYRLMGLPLLLPPLRERGNDILLLAGHFLESFVSENKIVPPVLTAGAKNKLLSYHYPGNIRELKAVVELAIVMCGGSEIRDQDIIFSLLPAQPAIGLEERTMREYNNAIIAEYLKKYQHDVSLVSKKLDIGRSTIYKLIKTREVVI